MDPAAAPVAPAAPAIDRRGRNALVEHRELGVVEEVFDDGEDHAENGSVNVADHGLIAWDNTHHGRRRVGDGLCDELLEQGLRENTD